MVSKSPVAAAEVRANQKNRILSRRQIESLITAGHSIVIVDDKVLKVDSWLPFHPGGDKAIQHMVGRDATDEVHRYVYTL
jgi:delta8-fatty-acid desaturase